MPEPEIADQQYTLSHYLTRSKRDVLPLDRLFTQSSTPAKGPGPLSEFVKRGREKALDQYLFFHAVASGRSQGDHDVRLPAHTWARAIGGHIDPKTGEVDSAALHLVSRNWRFLKKLNLIKTERVGRHTKVGLLSDSGSGAPYKHIGEGQKGKTIDGGYLRLPYGYWLDRWDRELSLPAKAMLLVALPHGDGFPLPIDRLPDWYGISRSTGDRGLDELRHHRLLHVEKIRRPEPESRVGFVDANHYELRPPFGPRGFKAKRALLTWKGAAQGGEKDG